MRRLGSVQRKMPCVFVTEVKEEPSTKREHQVPRSSGPAGLPRVGSSPRRRLHLNPRALPGAVEPPCSPGVSLQGSLRRPRVQVFLQIKVS